MDEPQPSFSASVSPMKPLAWLPLLLFSAYWGSPLEAGQSTACQPNWVPKFGSANVNHAVYAIAGFDDGSGGGPALYAGGFFTSAGGVVANYIAKFDGASWSPLGSGMSTIGGTSTVIDMAVYDDGGGPALYVAGTYASAGGVAGTSGIARWDGTSWSDVGGGVATGGLTPIAQALAVFDDGGGPALFATGSFTHAGGVAVNGIAKWDGVRWSPLGTGLSVGGGGRALAVFDDGSGAGPALYVGGVFASAGGTAAKNIAKWNGTSWSALGSGIGGGLPSVTALANFDDGSGAGPELYAGGEFSDAGGVAVNNIAKWDGTSWSSLESGGSGMSGGFTFFPPVQTLEVFDDGSGAGAALYAGGYFGTAGGVPANRIAKWDGVGWSPLGNGIGESGIAWGVLALGVFDDGGGGPSLFVGGVFTTSPAGDGYLAKWGCPPPTPGTPFCTAKTALVCGAASIGVSGASSATATSGFVIDAQPVRGCRSGLLLYSNQPVQSGVSFGGPGNGLLCLVGMGLRRAGPIESGGTSPQACDGVLSIDMNRFQTSQWTASGCNPASGQNNPSGFLGVMGTTVNAQMWARDSIMTGQVLSDGIGWVVGP